MSQKMPGGRSRGRKRVANQYTNSSPEYVVEKILGIRQNQETKAVEYLLKWEGYDATYNTWVPGNRLNCPQLIAEFEAKGGGEYTNEASLSGMPRQRKPKKLIGFERGLEPEEIIAASNVPGKLLFLMKWKTIEECDIVAAEEANIKCPQVVIRFYEKHLVTIRGKETDY